MMESLETETDHFAHMDLMTELTSWGSIPGRYGSSNIVEMALKTLKRARPVKTYRAYIRQ
jgi:hypothetical protein